MDLNSQAGLYLHVPFCRTKCPYCSFYSFPSTTQDIRRYLEAVQGQMCRWALFPEIESLSFATIFFGGGTPSILPVEALAQLLADLRLLFSFADGQPEITIEVNPGTIDAGGLKQLRRAGFNRLSIGVQSFNDPELQQLGRIHNGADAQATIASARRAGFDNCSFDLMYGLPGQTVDGWRETLDRALALAPVHLSMYELTVEAGTPFYMQAEQQHWALPAEDEVLAMMAVTETAVGRSGLTRYEISNYAVSGRECLHNCNYWQNGAYLGFGPGAVSAFGGGRRATVSDLSAFCRLLADGQPVWPEIEHLETEAAFRETVIMGLRMLSGVSVSALRQRFGLDLPTYYGQTLSLLLDQDVLIFQGDRLVLTGKGLLLANRVMAELV
ncbi:radical SAM family heme chaperone HemW [uncultured Desulfobulbus sp.]|uniref:radical SAM family heme chaperone HemW n=1 Tax=uncultured Desulfobulbus sp. TaxID=239745 RepID=UPI0029C97504|nr:radical SAM family heme chaperone HemW [uncultured Desulfobulbus sp.]